MSDNKPPSTLEAKEIYETLSRINDKLTTLTDSIDKMEIATVHTMDMLDKLTLSVEVTSGKLHGVEKIKQEWDSVISMLKGIEMQINKADQRLAAIEDRLDQKKIRLDNIEKRLYKDEGVINELEKQVSNSNKLS